jgi:hypothetical protein
MVRYLAFDAKSIRTLLSPKNQSHFDPDFPLFYKANAEGESPIDLALEDNQIRSVSLMINYIV